MAVESEGAVGTWGPEPAHKAAVESVETALTLQSSAATCHRDLDRADGEYVAETVAWVAADDGAVLEMDASVAVVQAE